MGVIFDASVFLAIEQSPHHLDKVINKREKKPFGISLVTVSELLHGVHRADSKKRRLKREAFVEKVIELFPIYPFD